MESKYNGYSFPLRDTVRREKVKFHNRSEGAVLWAVRRRAGQPWLCRSGL